MLEFGGAMVDEPVFLVSDATKLTISPTKANDEGLDLSNEVHSLFLFKPSSGNRLSPDAMIALDKMIAACGLTKENAVALPFLGQGNLHFNRLASAGYVKKLILLGITPDEIHLFVDSQYYNIFNFNGIDILISDNIEGITKEQKQQLWARLQTLFGLK
ncbi:MAG TPA: hypothetical protein PLJ43_07745 [Chitinophagales bacterium]|nr:hypothetical protein [Chitinophagales bacterium]HMX03490.1 hypothetical protein [Chitinophagales bacterium]HMZ88006.1 hypothetical protein [Chitinophagales bacterium]HNA57998.1 hypothetical protein [Chitinophagales bacterium]HNE46223.1 hypothetical protein [Chitinophagales bacterium]